MYFSPLQFSPHKLMGQKKKAEVITTAIVSLNFIHHGLISTPSVSF
jgi:hypothetical protein